MYNVIIMARKVGFLLIVLSCTFRFLKWSTVQYTVTDTIFNQKVNIAVLNACQLSMMMKDKWRKVSKFYRRCAREKVIVWF